MKRWRSLLPWLAALAALCLALLRGQGAFLARWHSRSGAWQPANAAPLQIDLRHTALYLTDGGETVWQSEPGWRVQDFAVGDIDHDGGDELLLLVWRRGNYGPSQPFWVEQNDWRYTQHIFIYKWQGGNQTMAVAVAPLWMSSRLVPGVQTWAMAADGTLEILTNADENTRWAWLSWGLERVG